MSDPTQPGASLSGTSPEAHDAPPDFGAAPGHDAPAGYDAAPPPAGGPGPVAAGIQYFQGYVERVRGGDLGSIPALIGLVVITIVFAIVRQNFLSAYNIEALIVETAATIIMAMGLVFVLLLGEIDLSAGTTGGMCAAVMAVLTARHGWPWWAGCLIGLALGIAIGLTMGWLRARVGIPSFVITLATFLSFQGVTVLLIGSEGSVLLSDSPVTKLDNSFVPVWLGWVLLGVAVLVYAAIKLTDKYSRERAGLPSAPLTAIAVKVVVLAGIGAGFTWIMGINRILVQSAVLHNVSEGMPWSVVLIVLLFILWHFVLTRTRYGRHVYAVGGNDEAARRAGIPVSVIRTSVFVICSGMAALSGLTSASYLRSVGSAAGAGNTLLLAVGAAVIGGTSLFGGRGRIIDAVIGGLVVGVINNGMAGLFQHNSLASGGWQWIVTGAVLLLAAGFDAVVRSRGRVK